MYILFSGIKMQWSLVPISLLEVQGLQVYLLRIDLSKTEQLRRSKVCHIITICFLLSEMPHFNMTAITASLFSNNHSHINIVAFNEHVTSHKEGKFQCIFLRIAQLSSKKVSKWIKTTIKFTTIQYLLFLLQEYW